MYLKIVLKKEISLDYHVNYSKVIKIVPGLNIIYSDCVSFDTSNGIIFIFT